MLRVLGILLFVFSSPIEALSMDDFTPDFLNNKNHAMESSNTDPQLAFSLPESSKKRNASMSNRGYCGKAHNVFCIKQNESNAITSAVESTVNTSVSVDQGANAKYINRNNNSYDQNAIANFNITNANQTALQAYSPKLNNYSTEQQIKNNLAVPFQADKNTNISVGQQQIEFSIKY